MRLTRSFLRAAAAVALCAVCAAAQQAPPEPPSAEQNVGALPRQLWSNAVSNVLLSRRAFGAEVRVPLDRLFEGVAEWRTAPEGDAKTAARATPSGGPTGAPNVAGSGGGGVPVLRDVPVLSSLFRRPEAPRLRPVESWLATHLPRAIGGDVAVGFEEVRTRRYGADGETTSVACELVVRADEGLRKKTQDVIDGLAALRSKQIMVEMTLVTRPAPPDARPLEKVESFEPAEWQRTLSGLREAAKSSAAMNVLSSPRVVTGQGQTATISVGGDVSYVKGYDVELVGEGSFVADPKIGVAHEGLSFEVLPVLFGAGDQVSLTLKVRLSSVKRPIAAFEAKLGDGVLKAERPEVATQSFESQLVLAANGGGAKIDGLVWTDPETRKPVRAELYVAARVAAPPAPETDGPKVFLPAGGRTEDVVMLDGRDVDMVAGAKTGDVLEVLDGDAVIGRWKVDHASGGFLVLKRVEGRAPVGAVRLRLAAK